MIAAVVAVDLNYGIGYKDGLLAHIPEDMKFFKSLTTGGTVIVGRKTYDTFPKKPLPNRLNIVVSRSKVDTLNGNVLTTNLDEIKRGLKDYDGKENIFIIGGGLIYKELLDYCERLYITHIHQSFDNVDTYFPDINLLEWKLTGFSEIREHNGIEYQFCVYDRKKTNESEENA